MGLQWFSMVFYDVQWFFIICWQIVDRFNDFMTFNGFVQPADRFADSIADILLTDLLTDLMTDLMIYMILKLFSKSLLYYLLTDC